MALEMNDLMMLKGMDSKEGLTPYEQYMIGYKQSKKPSNAAITSLVIGSGALLVGVTGWVFAGMQASSKAGQAKEAAQSAKEIAAAQYQAALQLMNSQNASTNATLDRVVRALERETDASALAEFRTVSRSF